MKDPLSNLDKIYWDLATKYKLRKEQIEEIILSQFRFVDVSISNTNIKDPKTIKGINITHLGKFLPRKKRIEKHLADILKNAERNKNSI